MRSVPRILWFLRYSHYYLAGRIASAVPDGSGDFDIHLSRFGIRQRLAEVETSWRSAFIWRSSSEARRWARTTKPAVELTDHLGTWYLIPLELYLMGARVLGEDRTLLDHEPVYVCPWLTRNEDRNKRATELKSLLVKPEGERNLREEARIAELTSAIDELDMSVARAALGFYLRRRSS